jgi:hypothetical protein
MSARTCSRREKLTPTPSSAVLLRVPLACRVPATLAEISGATVAKYTTRFRQVVRRNFFMYVTRSGVSSGRRSPARCAANFARSRATSTVYGTSDGTAWRKSTP